MSVFEVRPPVNPHQRQHPSPLTEDDNMAPRRDTQAKKQNERQMRFTYPSGSQPLEGYTIKRGIGIGGFGEVYFAISDAGKEVAIKRIQRNLDVELRGVRQCLNLKHVNLIALWDIRSNDLGESWVVMEYVPGYCLKTRLEQFPQGMPEKEAKEWFLSILSGVHYLHNNGIVHRDLKPGNIFYDHDQHVVKIGDYGLSKFISCSKRSGQTEAVGTFHYMAPEIGKGVYGKEIDVYALGIILYELLTGDVPFDGESAQEIIMKHLTADPNLSRVPAPFRNAIEGALCKDPESRFKSVFEMLETLPWSEDAPNITRFRGGVSSLERLNDECIESHDTNDNSVAFTNDVTSTEVLYIGEDHVEVIRNGPALAALHSRYANGLEPIVTGRQANSALGYGPKTKGSTPVIPDEPIARVVTGGLRHVVNWWNRSELSVPVKVTLTIVGAIILIINSSWLILVALTLGFMYLAYYTVRSWFVPADHEASLAETKAGNRRQRNQAVRRILAKQTVAEKLMDLTGSLVVAAISCVVFSMIGLAIKGTLFQPDINSWAWYAWLACTSTITTWSVLTASKSWEHREGDHWLRRLTLMFVGLVVGATSFAIGNLFILDGFAITSELKANAVPQFVGWPLLTSFLVFFASWLGITRIWSLADPSRRARFGIWMVGMQWVLAVIIAQVVNIDPIIFGMLAVVVTLATQLAAPFMNEEDIRDYA